MLVVLFVAWVGVGIRKLGVAGLLDVSVVTYRQVGSSSEGRSEVDGVEDGAFVVDESHLLF